MTPPAQLKHSSLRRAGGAKPSSPCAGVVSYTQRFTSKWTTRDICIALMFCCALSISYWVLRDRNGLSALRAAGGRRSFLVSNASWAASEQSVRKPQEVWAAGTFGGDDYAREKLLALFNETERGELRALCGRCLFHSLLNAFVVRDNGHYVFVKTGDIHDMWIRDSSVQLAIYMPRMVEQPYLRRLIEGAIRQQAFFILQDPWANAFSQTWRSAAELGKVERKLGRNGFVATRNFEVDSGAYFFNTLYNYYNTPGLYNPGTLLMETIVHDAVLAQLAAWRIEQQHGNSSSSYRYVELTNEGLGGPIAYTGMIWGGFRPSDDMQAYGFNIPANLYAATSLQRLVELNEALWQDPVVHAAAGTMAAEVLQGVQQFGIVEVAGERVYAYEVDGLGGKLVDFDDPNLPSLLSLPLHSPGNYDSQAYWRTRGRFMNPSKNRYFFQRDDISGLGSPHTPLNHIWPLATMVHALTSNKAQEQATLIRQLLRMQCGNGLMHESVFLDNLDVCTRPDFEWANAMFVVMYEQLFGNSCTAAAIEEHMANVHNSESSKPLNVFSSEARSMDDTAKKLEVPEFYGLMQSHVVHEKQEDPKKLQEQLQRQVQQQTEQVQQNVEVHLQEKVPQHVGEQVQRVEEQLQERVQQVQQQVSEAMAGQLQQAQKKVKDIMKEHVRKHVGRQAQRIQEEIAQQLEGIVQEILDKQLPAQAVRPDPAVPRNVRVRAQQQPHDYDDNSNNGDDPGEDFDRDPHTDPDDEPAQAGVPAGSPQWVALGDGPFSSFTVPVIDTKDAYKSWLPPGVSVRDVLLDPNEDGGVQGPSKPERPAVDEEQQDPSASDE